MAKNELVSLALISNGPMHAYWLNAIVKGMELEKLAKISPASIYNALTRLKKEGSVEVSAQKVGNMPERKVYTITEKGRERLQQELKNMLLTLEVGERPMNIAVIFAYGLPADDVIALVRQRIEGLQESITYYEEKLQIYQQKGYPPLVISSKAVIEHQKIEIEMAREFITFLEADPDFYKRLGEKCKQCPTQQLDAQETECGEENS